MSDFTPEAPEDVLAPDPERWKILTKRDSNLRRRRAKELRLEIGRLVKQAREARGMSVSDMADLMVGGNIHAQRVKELERFEAGKASSGKDQCVVDVIFLYQLAEALCLEVWELLPDFKDLEHWAWSGVRTH